MDRQRIPLRRFPHKRSILFLRRARARIGARLTVALLSAAYALSLSSVSLSVAITPVVGLSLAPRAALATLPISIQILATMSASLPASLLMGRIGRRAGHAVGTLMGAVGAAVATYGVVQGSFVLFCVGAAGIGALNGFAQFYRFAAADLAAPSWRAKAISWVLAGGVVAGVLGPSLAVAGADAAAVPFAGSYAAVVGLYALVAILLLFVRLAPPVDEEAHQPTRRLGTVFRSRLFVGAAATAMVGYGTMSLVMTATPIAMRAAGHSLALSSIVIQTHVVAMFAPSFFTGTLITRLGSGRVIAAGLVGLAGAAAVSLTGSGFWTWAVALALLGIGWNLMFVSGTTMVAGLHRTSERAKVQGVNDLLVFGTAAAGSFLAGYLLQEVGWNGIQMLVLPFLALAALFLWMCLHRRVLPPTPAAPSIP